ncbi:MAG: hypothetical protein ABI192_15650 [Bradyrhizobium sp.]
MQSTQTSREADPHDIFVIEPDVVLAARADHADPISSLLTPPVHPAPERSAPLPPVDTTLQAPANDDIQIPRDIHVSGQRPPRGRWAARATIGFVFALCSAAAAEGWDHYGDTARDTVKAVVANWTPFALTSQPAQAASAAAQPGAPAAADQAAAPPAPAAQPAQDAASAALASTGPAPTAAAPDQAQSMAQDVAAMGQQIASLKASIEQLKASQDQMAQQMSRDVAKTPVARTSQARPSEIRPAEPSLRAKVTAALSPRPLAPPPRKPRPLYPPAQTSAALPPAISAPAMQPAPSQYEPRAQAVDQSDDVVMRPPMPVR